jgi:hypothetical protein
VLFTPLFFFSSLYFASTYRLQGRFPAVPPKMSSKDTPQSPNSELSNQGEGRDDQENNDFSEYSWSIITETTVSLSLILSMIYFSSSNTFAPYKGSFGRHRIPRSVAYNHAKLHGFTSSYHRDSRSTSVSRL